VAVAGKNTPPGKAADGRIGLIHMAASVHRRGPGGVAPRTANLRPAVVLR